MKKAAMISAEGAHPWLSIVRNPEKMNDPIIQSGTAPLTDPGGRDAIFAAAAPSG